ncbi:uncharacterized protein N7484_005924 [Penicillium longicatenatum]|uniref:uncharacterized protein n=1 Tax=Penicillium longicatenatum TaxID=1561947 RepID=UPI002548AF32|nr:uncharacterized protein N7484_005924 [Penicillium longicatenatum]KAJ5643417.1 hypothetical protein N7484_005924 [Penicillium longicatenatum]
MGIILTQIHGAINTEPDFSVALSEEGSWAAFIASEITQDVAAVAAAVAATLSIIKENILMDMAGDGDNYFSLW